MKKILLLLVALLATTTVWAEEYITDVMVIGGTKNEVNMLKSTYSNLGWTVIDQDLNSGCGSGSDYIYMLYKKADESTVSPGAFITKFVIRTYDDTAPDHIVNTDGRICYLVPFDGGEYFKGTKGDLNSHCGSGSATIHLYYTKDYPSQGRDYGTVKSISFNTTADGGVTTMEGTTGYDLNTGCGSGSDYIYMHAERAPGWIYTTNYAGDQCYIKGFEGPKSLITNIVAPVFIDGATVIGFSGPVFNGFSNLETIKFFGETIIDEMPSMQGCSNFYNVRTSNTDYLTPPSMKTISSSAFAGTAINEITLDAVTSVKINAFSGCNNLSSVTFNTSPVLIENSAFENISSNCQVSYPGSIEDWNPLMYIYSPNLIIKNGTSWSCGWCGGTNEASHNMLYWELINSNLKISSYGDWWESYPDKQIIATKRFGKSMKTITLEHVYSIGLHEFENCLGLNNVYLEPTLHSIGKEAFYGCYNLRNIWFDGNQQQWDAVTKDANWKDGTSNLVEHWHCMVIFNNNGHGSTPDPKTIQWSNLDKVDEPEPLVADGYNFKGWFTDAECTNQWDFNTAVPGDMTLYAGWEEIVVNVPGDVNCDGAVTTADVTCIYNYLLNGDETFIATSDVDGDGFITTVDITAIYNILLNE